MALLHCAKLHEASPQGFDNDGGHLLLPAKTRATRLAIAQRREPQAIEPRRRELRQDATVCLRKRKGGSLRGIESLLVREIWTSGVDDAAVPINVKLGIGVRLQARHDVLGPLLQLVYAGPSVQGDCLGIGRVGRTRGRNKAELPDYVDNAGTTVRLRRDASLAPICLELAAEHVPWHCFDQFEERVPPIAQGRLWRLSDGRRRTRHVILDAEDRSYRALLRPTPEPLQQRAPRISLLLDDPTRDEALELFESDRAAAISIHGVEDEV
mmetsp:Transcript_67935/g.189733  ORF Transcript_67935/g.189733 Transcript_67935/m.189733 type:complete len:268 (-) Transcript_67935:2092-2895(-)